MNLGDQSKPDKWSFFVGRVSLFTVADYNFPEGSIKTAKIPNDTFAPFDAKGGREHVVRAGGFRIIRFLLQE
jgi:hypothetical protein